MVEIRNAEELEKMILKWGFLPFFKNDIEGFSVEELTPHSLWFSDEADGPWEWKGPVICGGMCAYGKLYRRKAGYVSLEWLPDLMNYRRSKYVATKDETLICNTIREHESLLSREAKKMCGYSFSRKGDQNRLVHAMSDTEHRIAKHVKSKRESFESAITNLQMSLLCVIADFEYLLDHSGKPYGWGIARYTTPEALYEADSLKQRNLSTPMESLQRMVLHLQNILPQATNEQIIRLLE